MSGCPVLPPYQEVGAAPDYTAAPPYPPDNGPSILRSSSPPPYWAQPNHGPGGGGRGGGNEGRDGGGGNEGGDGGRGGGDRRNPVPSAPTWGDLTQAQVQPRPNIATGTVNLLHISLYCMNTYI